MNIKPYNCELVIFPTLILETNSQSSDNHTQCVVYYLQFQSNSHSQLQKATTEVLSAWFSTPVLILRTFGWSTHVGNMRIFRPIGPTDLLKMRDLQTANGEEGVWDSVVPKRKSWKVNVEVCSPATGAEVETFRACLRRELKDIIDKYSLLYF